MPEGVNSLGPPQSIQTFPSLYVVLSYSLPLSVTPHLIHSATFLFDFKHCQIVSLRLCFHSSIFPSASMPVCSLLEPPC